MTSPILIVTFVLIDMVFQLDLLLNLIYLEVLWMVLGMMVDHLLVNQQHELAVLLMWRLRVVVAERLEGFGLL